VRTPVVLLVDRPEANTSALADSLAELKLHVYWTVAPQVALALSTDVFFDTVLIHQDHLGSTVPNLASTLARDGHRSLVIVADPEQWPPDATLLAPCVDGAIRRDNLGQPLVAAIHRLARDGDFDAFRSALELGRTTTPQGGLP
jgi:hypothetical protein